jgi:hypothetical protein
MKTIVSLRRQHYVARVSIFLITLALIAGMVGCVGVRYDLTIYSTEGGDVTKPGEATFTYSKGKVVDLVARPEESHRFVDWTGNVSTIANVTAASTTITMGGDYSITANFALEILEIRDWGDLDAIRNNLSATYILMNDLDYTTANYTELAGPTANGREGWQPIGTRRAPFDGSFDGQGYEIEDLLINRPDERYVGLFGYVDKGGVVKDIGVVNATVAGKDNVGGLVGNNGGTVSSSYSTGSVSGDDSVGGLVGDNGGTVEYSYSTGNVTSEQGSYIGGLMGINDGGTVSNSHSSGSVSGDENVGGLVGINEGGTVSNNCYSIGSVTGKSYVGGLVGCNYEESNVSDSYSKGSVTGNWSVGGLVGFSYKSTVSNSHYNYDEVLINGQNIITTGALFGDDFDQWRANGDFLDVNERLSQEGSYYVVNNVTDFKELLAFGQNNFLEFRLTNDLDLANEPNFYIPYFAGEFDGNGHKISNLSFNSTFAYNVGLFGYLARGGIVTRVGVENAEITGASRVGGLVGANWEGTVTNSHSTGSLSGKSYIGGLVGCNDKESTVEKSCSSGSVSGESYVGGLVGDNEWTVSTCHFTGNVTSEKGSYIGGLVGWNGAEVSESYSTGRVNGRLWVGGLVGRNGGDVSASNSSVSVSGYDDVGGLVGANDHTVEQCYSSSNVTGSNKRVGGLVGSNNGGLVSRCYSTGSVSGKSYVGGLVGQNKKYKDKDATVNGSYSTGRVSGEEDVGGLVGWNDGTVSSSFWDKDTGGQAASAGGTGKTTAEMKSIATFRGAGWVISEVDPGERKPGYTWYILKGGVDYPFLSWQSV